jgi:hypothetical protein
MGRIPLRAGELIFLAIESPLTLISADSRPRKTQSPDPLCLPKFLMNTLRSFYATFMPVRFQWSRSNFVPWRLAVFKRWAVLLAVTPLFAMVGTTVVTQRQQPQKPRTSCKGRAGGEAAVAPDGPRRRRQGLQGRVHEVYGGRIRQVG